MISRRLANIRKFCKSKSNMIGISISLIVAFGIFNFMLIGMFILKANIISSLLLTMIIVLIFFLILIVVLSLNSFVDRLRVLSNNFHLKFLQISNILLIIIFLFYIIMILRSLFIVTLLGKKIFAVIGVITTLFSFWIGSLKKVQLLNVLIVAENVQYCSNEYKLNGETYFKVRAQCEGNSEDIIEFAGFCLSKDFNIIEQKESEYKNLIYKPFINNVDVITIPEKIEPHKLSSCIEISVKSIKDKCKEEGITLEEDNKVYILYKDSKENYFGAGVVLN
ncbi:hypothetical protein [Lactobacillus gasseri]|nr:hypothetical protein [Lactobacillus gasseri]MCQ5246551.1 hypothetical protein [Lactobacillus gasseri]OOK87386.1 hypothetical protein B0B48_06375 [Lactobacillus gasseri]VEF35757.1 Uncharacterised protein [Lactobacillus paragasseri]